MLRVEIQSSVQQLSGSVNLDIDVSSDKNPGIEDWWQFRACQTSFLQASLTDITTKNVVEVWAAKHALRLAAQEGYQSLVIESYSLQTPHVIWTQGMGRRMNNQRLQDCLHLLNSLSSVIVSFAYGELNQIAIF